MVADRQKGYKQTGSLQYFDTLTGGGVTRYRPGGGITTCPARFRYFQWPYCHDDQWVRLPAWVLLLVFHSNLSHKMHRFEMMVWDRQTDEQIAALLNAPYHVKSLRGYRDFRRYRTKSVVLYWDSTVWSIVDYVQT